MYLRVGPDSVYTDRSQYNLPLEIGCFSRDSECKFRDDNRQMKFIAMPERSNGLRMDLNAGYSNYIDVSDDEESRLQLFLKWILSHGEEVGRRFLLNSPHPKLDFICSSRGILGAFCSAIYDTSEDWMIHATKFRSVVYLSAVDTEKKIQLKVDLGEKGHLMSTWGFKFEQYMTSGSMDSRPNTSIPVNENEKYFSVMNGELDYHRILFVAEVDGVDPEYFKGQGHDPNSPLRYVELKTSRMMTSIYQQRNFQRYKLLKWYLQSYLSGTPKVICGFRDDEGIVRQLGFYNVRDMPKIAENLWSDTACLNFCSHVLNFVKRCVVKDDPKAVYEFYFNPTSRIITCKELPPGSQGILPAWYTESV